MKKLKKLMESKFTQLAIAIILGILVAELIIIPTIQNQREKVDLGITDISEIYENHKLERRMKAQELGYNYYVPQTGLGAWMLDDLILKDKGIK